MAWRKQIPHYRKGGEPLGEPVRHARAAIGLFTSGLLFQAALASGID